MKTPTTDRWRYRKVSSTYHHEEEVGIEALAAAIVRQAVMDYKYADEITKGTKSVSPATYANRFSTRAEQTKRECVKFFKSQWYGTLCDIPAEKILRRLGV